MLKNFYLLAEKEPSKLVSLIQESKSYSEMLQKLGISPTNNHARKVLKNWISENNIDTSGYDPYYHNTNQTKTYKNLSPEEFLPLLVKSEKFLGTRLRKGILAFNLLEYKCSTEGCLLSDSENIVWNNKKITLDLDHINGDNKDNRLENLRFLCPNCHSQTETYKGRNTKQDTSLIETPQVIDPLAKRERYNSLPSKEILLKKLKTSGVNKTALAKHLGISKYALQLHLEGKLKSNRAKTSWGTPAEVIALVEELGWESAGRAYGVSGNAVRKYLTNKDVDITQVSTPHNSGRKKAV